MYRRTECGLRELPDELLHWIYGYMTLTKDRSAFKEVSHRLNAIGKQVMRQLTLRYSKISERDEFITSLFSKPNSFSQCLSLTLINFGIEFQPKTLDHLFNKINIQSCPNLYQLNIHTQELTDQCLDSLKPFIQLQHLDLSHCYSLTDQALEHLKGLNQLQL